MATTSTRFLLVVNGTQCSLSTSSKSEKDQEKNDKHKKIAFIGLNGPEDDPKVFDFCANKSVQSKNSNS